MDIQPLVEQGEPEVEAMEDNIAGLAMRVLMEQQTLVVAVAVTMSLAAATKA